MIYSSKIASKVLAKATGAVNNVRTLEVAALPVGTASKSVTATVGPSTTVAVMWRALSVVSGISAIVRTPHSTSDCANVVVHEISVGPV